MFLSKFDSEEIVTKTAENLYLIQNRNELNYLQKKAGIVRHLENAANILDELGLEKQAQILTNLMEKIVNGSDDSIAKNMEYDLEHTGLVLESASKTLDHDLNLADVVSYPVQDLHSAEDMLQNLPHQSFSGHS